jgi:hypothetical protein
MRTLGNYTYSDEIPDPPGGVYTTITDTGTLTRTREYTDIIAGTASDVFAGSATKTTTDYEWNAGGGTWDVYRTRQWVTQPNGDGDGWETVHTDSLIPANDDTYASSASLEGNYDTTLSNTDNKVVDEYAQAGVSTGTYTVEGFDRIDQAAYEAAVTAWFSGLLATSPEITGTGCIAEREWDAVTSTCGGTTEERDCWDRAREERVFYRWTVHDDHAGSYFKIEWDEVFIPEGGGAATLTAKSWEWTGGSKESPWSLPMVVPAGELGTVEVRNVRYICYRSNFGSKPQTHGGIQDYP